MTHYWGIASRDRMIEWSYIPWKKYWTRRSMKGKLQTTYWSMYQPCQDWACCWEIVIIAMISFTYTRIAQERQKGKTLSRYHVALKFHKDGWGQDEIELDQDSKLNRETATHLLWATCQKSGSTLSQERIRKDSFPSLSRRYSEIQERIQTYLEQSIFILG